MKKTYRIRITNKNAKSNESARLHRIVFKSKTEAEAWAELWNKMMSEFNHQVVEG